MTAGPPAASDPQSTPRDIPAMPDPNRDLPPLAEGEERHWPDLPINEVPDDEREALLQQAGPVGEQARLAWNAYQAEHPQGDDPAAIAKERQRLTEMGQTPPEDAEALAQQSPTGPEVSTPSTQAAQASTPAPGSAGAPEEVDTPEEEEAETGAQTEREEAEAKAAERGLEIRDFGTSGDWRVYDPKTGPAGGEERPGRARPLAGAPRPGGRPGPGVVRPAPPGRAHRRRGPVGAPDRAPRVRAHPRRPGPAPDRGDARVGLPRPVDWGRAVPLRQPPGLDPAHPA